MLRDIFRDAAGARTIGIEERVRAVVDAYLGSYRSGDIDGRVALFAVDGVFEDPVGSEPMRGRDAIRAFWQAGAAAFRIEMALDSLYVSGSEAAFNATATLYDREGDMVRIRIIETLALNDDGLIMSLRAYFDAGSID